MTSKQSEQENKVLTSCQHCVFSINENQTQVGCKWNRLEQTTYTEAYNDEGEFYVVDGLCNLRREEEVDEEQFNKEIALSFLVIINLNSVPSIKAKNVKIDYKYKDKLEMHIVGHSTKHKEIIKLKNKLNCTAHVTDYSDYVINRIIEKTRASYVCVVEDSDLVDLNCINNKINKKHQKPIYEKYDGCTYISHLAYHVMFSNTDNKNYSDNVNILSKKLENYPCLEEKSV